MINVIKNQQNKIIKLWSHGNDGDSSDFLKTMSWYKDGYHIAAISQDDWDKHCEKCIYQQSLNKLVDKL
jgi:hypothetical protein